LPFNSIKGNRKDISIAIRLKGIKEIIIINNYLIKEDVTKLISIF